ncbi:hypothetical protein [Geomesophilobacter sediminis]|uniref:Bacterial surface antigen (D15) domain-containing protein n=1 Tax=Geomesophilobacter sediminis TaxID=2798584 RepID=A0A8J7IWG7_9BACT|nr:hypothetical protein [Geomesophilobacter sediminis]MBJ6723842.1 hypothetical protein [Geomesophilobacter sediminis]
MMRPFTASFFGLIMAGTIFSGNAVAEEFLAYKTPLAGEPCDIECMGVKVAVPGRNRENTMALVLGGAVFAPNLAGTDFLPMAALYLKHRWNDIRVRGTISGVSDDVDINKSYGNLQLLGHLDNYTIPFAQTETNGSQEIAGTDLRWGTVNGRVGLGLRYPMDPYQVDNDLRFQLYYQTGYLYTQRVSDTSPTALIPQNSLVHGPYFRFRYDGFKRNLMELPHEGVAAGINAEFMHRSPLAPDNTPTDTRHYLKASGYLMAATGVPLLSERNRLLFSVNGGISPYGKLDRFSAFRIGGGPIPTESDDLDRQVLPGALFQQFPVASYLISWAEYRREFYPFLFLHLRATHALVERENFASDSPDFHWGRGAVASIGLTTGFLWESELDLDYSYDSAILRNGHTGGSFFFLWSKSF